MASATANSFDNWVFDVSALMVLIGEAEELRYRLAGRQLAECLVAAPVAGIQSYLKSYDVLHEPSQMRYFSPYGCKSAPLRNMKLDNAIRRRSLLDDGRYTTFRIPATLNRSRNSGALSASKLQSWPIAAWLIFTWVCFISLLLFCVKSPAVTWIGISNCLVFTGWSMAIRLIEHLMVRSPPPDPKLVTGPADPDTAVFLGRGNSALILEGSREDIKKWTSASLTYHSRFLGLKASGWQAATRLITVLVLLCVFTTVPNGSTIDQLAFILINVLGQVNVLVGGWLNAKACLGVLERSTAHSTTVNTRTQVYGRILRQLKGLEDKTWVDKVALLPETQIWQEWRDQVIAVDDDPKELYDRIADGAKRSRGGADHRSSETSPPQPSPPQLTVTPALHDNQSPLPR